ncbi:hypothetical protein HNP84_006651 [Thermocatellispora tengchongensis]|uniref:Amidohydrolase 3 domain-containing protein n=1 Tax=Thermocatellispora tengchongensis TaxID=1073253 RepID=A0A840PD33_9ACTN|nr:amidohydrolase family protein [Thermocatellispora tengchongensis]MBB5136899.1 hypothetical protein [Thermocatellispora tengchongensis]
MPETPPSTPSDAGRADWLLTGGAIETFDPARPPATAIAIRDGRVLAVGETAELEALAGPGTRRTDLGGRAVLPGFCDTHIHFEKVAHEFGYLQLRDARSVADVLDAVAARAARAAPGEWIRCNGDDAGWHEHNLAERRLPHGDELDAAAGGRPVFLYRRPDHGVLGGAAAERLRELLAGFSAEEWDPATGWLRGPAVRVVNDSLYRPGVHEQEHRLRILCEASRRLLAMGVTGVVDPGLPAAFEPSWELYRQAGERGLIAQRVWLMNRLDWRRPFQEEYERVRATVVPPPAAGGLLRPWAVKLLLDGEFTGAWMRPGEEQGEPGAGARYSEEELRAVLSLCAERGRPLCVHAMGAGAIEAVTRAVRAMRERLTPGQVSIAHAFLIDAPLIRECAELDIRISVQPALAYTYAREMRQAWGPLAGRNNPLATMAALGLRFAGGSDTHPCAPLAGASIAVTRRAWDGSSLGGHEALTPREALAMFTREAGHYTGSGALGTLVPGAPADLAIWARSPLDLAPQEWPGLRPDLVAVAGRAVWAPDEHL